MVAYWASSLPEGEGVKSEEPWRNEAWQQESVPCPLLPELLKVTCDVAYSWSRMGKLKEAMDRFTQRVGGNRFEEVSNDYSSLATHLINKQATMRLRHEGVGPTCIAFPTQDSIAKKYPWHDVWMGKYPQQKEAAL